MKIMILSDSHSVSKTDLLTLLKNNSVNYYVHCGDIYMTYDGINLNSFYFELIASVTIDVSKVIPTKVMAKLRE